MGFAASQGRLQMLTARKNDMELKLQMIQQQRMFWADVATKLMMAAARDPEAFDSESQQGRRLESDRAVVAQIDKLLEMEANRLDKQREAAVTEIQAVRKVISKNIQQSFSLMGNA